MAASVRGDEPRVPGVAGAEGAGMVREAIVVDKAARMAIVLTTRLRLSPQRGFVDAPAPSAT
ncbi:hypothetical protein [Arthrobacter methylotrophus]|uniref:Uncharacterized protein n=1 Tax=Arthrobacter methylotrophus TaxID=121291 RepID=A0ABV5UTG1_9MICC